MRLYRPYGGVVEAVQWDGANEAEVRDILGDDRPLPRVGHFVVRRSGGIAIYTGEELRRELRTPDLSGDGPRAASASAG